MRFNHPEKIASKCKHIVHPSSSSRTPWCSQCIVSSAKEDLERSREAFKAKGGPGAPPYMRDLAWNVARLRYAVKASRVDKVIQNARLRDERERLWEETHRQRISKAADNSRTNCIACDATKTICLPDAQSIVSLTIAWWERKGAYEAVRAQMIELPTHISSSKKVLSRPHSKPPSCLRSFIKSYRERKTVSEGQRQAWEDRCKLDRAIRRKYDLADDYDIDPEVLDFPIPASHARYHHRRAQESQSAGEQRANRRRRREEGYKPSRSSLALTELAEHVILDETEVERLRLVEKGAELRRSERVAAAEVGYLYFIGSLGLLEKWKDDIQQSNLSLIYRKNEHEQCREMVYVDRNHGEAEDDEQL